MAIKGRDNKMVSSSNYMDGRISRTKVGRHFKWRSTFSAGYMIPFWCDEVLPGQNKSVDLGELVRSITPLGPTMDNSFLDLFFFFVPNRLLWDHWEEFIAGYNKEAWTQDVVYRVPQIKFDPAQYVYDSDVAGSRDLAILEITHSFVDYLPGLCNPGDLVDVSQYLTSQSDESDYSELVEKYNDTFSFSALFPRAFVKIWNDWFRDENLQDEIELYTGDNDEYADQFAFNLTESDGLPKLAKYHNRFTSCLPQPQKGPDVLIPMDNLQVGSVPPSFSFDGVYGLGVDSAISDFNSLNVIYKDGGGDPVFSSTPSLIAKNVSNTIRQLRLATQTELLLARDARGGTRYVESLLSHFGVHNGDARLQRAEYLGSKQIPLQIMQVTNTAGTSANPLGNVGGQSVTKDNSHYFMKGFTEHGIVFCVGGVRTNISYSHGIRKMYQRRDRFDFIWPEFKHIGDVPLYTKELKQSSKILNTSNYEPVYDRVFGYTPYGSELREGYNFNNGLFRDNAPGSLSYLTYQEGYSSFRRLGSREIPTLSNAWIQENPATISNTLVDQSGPQFYALFDLYSEDVIPLDPTSDPGLMDHF